MHVSVDPADLSPVERHKMTIGTIVPRPIAWTTTVDSAGRVNLAPFSYFMACHSYVPALAISVGSRHGEPKDTRANIEATGELVVNTVTADLVERMNVTAAAFPPEVDELAFAGLTPLPSKIVAPPRVAESPVNIECRVLETLHLGDEPRVSSLFVAQVVMWHVREDLLLEGFKVDQAAIDAIGRMGGSMYVHARDLFTMSIPDWRELLGPGAGGPLAGPEGRH
ncbi:MAG: flavin reductase family protein [Anaerolineae bacterium]|jgi:flavin reductase (DIM6/NTAB) family NADH-FMN oxidoreductase RutF